MNTSRKVLLVGWDSADWRVVRPMISKGELPNLRTLIAQGVSGNIATLYPALSPMLWTSIATGKRPHKHGIHGFTEPDPDNKSVRPITSLSRKSKAVWNILSQNGKNCVVIGWWPSHPAEPLPDGVMVSNSFQRAPSPSPKDPWPIAPGTVFPPSLSGELEGRRIHPSKIEKSVLRNFVPKINEVDKKKDKRLKGLSKIVADCLNIHSASVYIMKQKKWDFFAVYHDAIDHFGHAFMRYHPPRQDWIPKQDFELYTGVIEAGYRLHDQHLGELLQVAGPDSTILLMSDHGFHPDNLRPAAIPIEPAGPAIEHRQYGIFVLKGPGIKSNEQVYGANVLDICPSLLSLFDLPPGQDMDGKPLITAWTNPPKIEPIPSWEAVPGDGGAHPPGTELNLSDHREAFKQLEDLGYVEPQAEDVTEAVEKSRRELRYNLACSYLDAQMFRQAADIFTALWERSPEEHRFGEKLLMSNLFMGQTRYARTTFEKLRANRRTYSAKARKELKVRKIDFKKDSSLPKKRRELSRLAGRARLSRVPMMQLESLLRLSEGTPGAAAAILRKLCKLHPHDPALHLQLARALIASKKWKLAEQAYKKVLIMDADSAHAFVGLSQVYLEMRRNHEAAEAALDATGKLYYNPLGHYLLGVALHRLGHIDEALQALRVCVNQNCNFVPGHQRLVNIYKNRVKDAIRSRVHLDQIERIKSAEAKASGKDNSANASLPDCRTLSDPTRRTLTSNSRSKNFVTVVSGLPRSGTSLMMQMLAAGGIEPLHDNHRLPDMDNPKGYYEFEPAKNLRSDSSWMRKAIGMSLKLVAQLLPYLPLGVEYRIIFMERSLDEVLSSQGVMLTRKGRRGASITSEKLRSVFEAQLLNVQRTLEERRIPTLRISHRESIIKPEGVVRNLIEFLGGPLDLNAMIASIDPSLHRQKSHVSSTRSLRKVS